MVAANCVTRAPAAWGAPAAVSKSKIEMPTSFTDHPLSRKVELLKNDAI